MISKLLTALVVTMVMSGVAGAEDRPALYGEISFSGVTDSDFRNLSGGWHTGLVIPIDSDRGLMMRTLYTKAQWGDLALESMQVSGLLSWYAGKSWDFYILVGREAWMTGDMSGSDWLGGLGVSRRIYTADGDEWAVPFTIDACIDFSSDDTPDGAISRINVSFRFSKPVKK